VIPPPAALLFDLDGTLVDSRRDIAAACNAARKTHGLPPLPLESIVAMVGDGARALVARAFGVDLRSQDRAHQATLDAALATFRAAYLAQPAAETDLLPGARDALALGLPCALVTNKPRDVTDALLDALGIAGCFVAIHGGGDGALKPAPDGLLTVLGQMGVAPRSAWMIGDGPQDVEAGRAAGCPTVLVRGGIADAASALASAPDLVLDGLPELVALVRAARA